MEICICVNDVKQTFIKKFVVLLNLLLVLSHQHLEKYNKITFRYTTLIILLYFSKFYATCVSNSALFSFGVKYPNTPIGILFDLFRYAFPCFIKSSKL